MGRAVRLDYEAALAALVLPRLDRSDEERAWRTATLATAPPRVLRQDPDAWRALWEQNHQAARAGARLP